MTYSLPQPHGEWQFQTQLSLKGNTSQVAELAVYDFEPAIRIDITRTG